MDPMVPKERINGAALLLRLLSQIKHGEQPAMLDLLEGENAVRALSKPDCRVEVVDPTITEGDRLLDECASLVLMLEKLLVGLAHHNSIQAIGDDLLDTLWRVKASLKEKGYEDHRDDRGLKALEALRHAM